MMLWLLAGYMWLYVHRPFEVWASFEGLRIERIYMIGTLLAYLVTPNKGWVANRLNVAFFAFVAAMVLSWGGSPEMARGTKTVEDQFKVAVFYVLAMSVVRDEKSLRYLLATYLVAVGLYMTHSLWEYHNGRHVWRMGISRMVGVDATYNDPNTFAATLCYSLPLTLPFWFERPRGWKRWLLAYYSGLTVVCIILTGSRTGFVGLAFAAAMIALSSSHWRKALVLAAILAPAIWLATPTELKHRYLTIIDPSYGPENALVSAESRKQGFFDGVRLWGERPLMGYGPGTFGYITGTGKPSHNLYGQTLGEMGTFGALSLLGILFAFWGNAREVRATFRMNPMFPKDFCYHVTRSVSLAVMLLLLLGLAGHNLYRYTWFWFGAFQGIAVFCIRAKVRTSTSATSPNTAAMRLRTSHLA